MTALKVSMGRIVPTAPIGGKFDVVPQFVIEREIPGVGALSEAEIRKVSLQSLKALTEMGPQIQWLHSYVTEDKIYCVYLAPDENSVTPAGQGFQRIASPRSVV